VQGSYLSEFGQPVAPLRIVHVNDVASVGPTLVQGLRAVGHDARFVDVPKIAARWPYPWKLAAFPARLAWLAGLGLRLRRNRVDLVHIHYASQAVLGPLSSRPYVVHCHGTDVRGATPTSRWGRSIAPWLRRAVGVVYATPDLEPWVRSFRSDALLLPGPVDTNVFRPQLAEPTADVLVSTRLDPIKGADQIVAAARDLLRRRPSTTFTVIDQGSETGAMRAALGSSGRFLPPQPHSSMPELLARHRVFVGQFGLGIVSQAEVEALAAGVPVVSRLESRYAADAPPIVGSGNGREAAAQMERLLDGSADRAQVASTGRAWAIQHRSIPAITGRLLEQYRAFGLAA
jgi:glycosyltransferase involved in cell wall biosynthesis